MVEKTKEEIGNTGSIIINDVTKQPKDFEEVLDYLGGFGKFQFLIMVLLLSIEIPAAFVGLNPIFVGSLPDPNSWTCLGVQLDPIDLCSCNGTISASESAASISLIAEWSLICDAAWVNDFVTSIQLLGILFGNIYVSQLSDWYGRRYTYLAVNLFTMTSSILCAVSPNPYIYGIARFGLGGGISGAVALAGVYIIEFLPAKWRKLTGSVVPLGEVTMLFALIAYLIRPWRSLLWISVAPFLFILLTFPLLPESPRWLLRNKKTVEAKKVFDYMARLNRTEVLDMDTIKAIAAAENPQASSELPSSKTTKLSYFDLFRYKEIRTPTICLIIIWSSWSLSFFGLIYNIRNLPGNIYLNVFYLGLADSIGFPAFLFTGNKLGRRRSVFLFSTICSVFLVAIAVMFLTVDTNDYPRTILLFCLFAKFGTAGTRSALRTMTGETFPTSIRTMGFGLTSGACAFTGFLAPQLVFVGTEWPSVPFFAFALISLCGSLVAFLMKETSGKPLTDDIFKRNKSFNNSPENEDFPYK